MTQFNMPKRGKSNGKVVGETPSGEFWQHVAKPNCGEDIMKRDEGQKIGEESKKPSLQNISFI